METFKISISKKDLEGNNWKLNQRCYDAIKSVVPKTKDIVKVNFYDFQGYKLPFDGEIAYEDIFEKKWPKIWQRAYQLMMTFFKNNKITIEGQYPRFVVISIS